MLKKLFNRKPQKDDKSKKKSDPQKAVNKPRSSAQPTNKSNTNNRPSTNKKRPPKKVWTPADFVVPVEEGKTRFHDLGLHDTLLHGIADLGFQYCSDIQAESLPHTLKGLDMIGKAQTGTGKTAAFLVTIIDYLIRNPIPKEDRYASEPRGLVIAPTRELALQIEKDAKALAKHTDLSVFSVVGGMDYGRQKDFIHDHVIDILVATPGRLIDFLQNKDLFLDQIDFLVIDEADRMLDMGFIPDVKRIIYRCAPKDNRQTLLFSATFNNDVINLSQNWTQDAVKVEIAAEELTTEKVEQKIIMVPSDKKLDFICKYIDEHSVKRAIIFGNRRDETRKLEARLKQKGIKAALLSGEVPQQKRLRTLENFKKGSIEILVATDVAGRGIHVDGVSHVFNYNLPEDPEDYVHRIGRTGRAGEAGVSISFACEDDAFLLPEIEEYIGKKLPCEYPDL